jgi:TRAP-type uncharacterized transport system substrate-binding protein
LLPELRRIHPEYQPGTVPKALYGTSGLVTTVRVRDFLLVSAGMADELAYALVATLLAEQERLAAANIAALTIDPRAAISTQPVPLHPGAVKWFRTAKGATP